MKKNNTNKFFQFIALAICFLSLLSCYDKTTYSTNQVDSIDVYMEKFKIDENINHQKKYLLKAYNYNNTIKNDSLRLRNLSLIINPTLDIKDLNLLKKINNEKLTLAKNLKDTLSLGECYWSNGDYYVEKTVENVDSAYYSYNKAKILFEKINYHYGIAKVLINMSHIKSELGDYTGSEKLIFQAIKKLKILNKNTSLYICYSHLGSNYRVLKEYEKALFYSKKAQVYLDKSKYKEFYVPYHLNLIGLIYQSLRDYPKAISHFERALKNKKNKNSTHYTTIKGNLVYTKFKSGDTINTDKELSKVLKSREKINYATGISQTKLFLAEFYAYRGDSIKAIKNIKSANIFSKNVKSYKFLLKGLKLLAQIDKKNRAIHLEKYIKLNDSIQFEQRSIRNKFTRIEYETDEYIEETKRLSTQNILISVIGGILIIVLALLYFIRRQRAKTKELLFESEQQKANEEIYALMLKQQLKLEEGRTEERHRISEELHDGVLGKLFGTRVGLGYLSLKGDDEDVSDYKSYVEELQDIEKEIRDISHELKNNILKTENGYISVIEDYVKNLSKLKNFKYSLKSDDTIDWDTINDKLKVTLYRITQEATQNIVKHAQADTVLISFTKQSKLLHLVIEDNGVGFNDKKKKKGIGLKNMESRILKHQGQLLIYSKLGEGTTITITVTI